METNNSQDFADYYNECLLIDQTKSWDDILDEDTNKPTSDDFEAEWLRDLGFDSLVNNIEAGKEDEDENLGALLMTLTNHQAAVVQKRITTFKTTVRKGRIPKQKIRDVREVFPQSSESLSAGTRSRSATPDSLDSISPSHTPPSPREWSATNLNGSPTPSQGYHSHSRSSPDLFEVTDGSKPREEVRRTSSYGTDVECCLPLELNQREPNFTKIFRSPSNVDHFSSLPLTEGYRTIQQHTKQHNGIRFTGGTDGFSRPHKHAYNFSSTGTLGSDTGIEILDFHFKGSLHVCPKNRAALSQLLEPGLSDSDISLDIREDSDADYRLDLDWGFEKKPSANSNNLPEFMLVNDRLGLTQVDDLGCEDIKKIRPLALIELTALFDTHGIQYNRRRQLKKKKKDSESAVFGVPLAALLAVDRRIDVDCKVPLVLKKILRYLEKHGLNEEGILRVPGVLAKIQSLKQEIEMNFYSSPGLVDQALRAASTNDVAALLKQFFRELPVPLLSNEYMDAFFQIDSIPDKADQIKALKLLVLLLPDVHRDTLKALFEFLAKVIDHESQNRMSLQNVAMIIAPNLFLPKKLRKNAERDLAVEINLAATTCKITKMMIKYCDILWTVPRFLINQIREQNEAAMYHRKPNKENGKHVKKLLGKSKKADIYRKINNEVDFQEGIIRIQASQFGKLNAPVKLENFTTARDIVYKFAEEVRKPVDITKHRSRKEMFRRSSSELSANSNLSCLVCIAEPSTVVESHVLYEVGGNIGERCLAPNANMIAVYQRNPNATWVIRCKHWTNQPVVKEVMLM